MVGNMAEGKSNLFIYGSLAEAEIFQSVSGLSFTSKPSETNEQTLLAEAAFLPAHRKVSPDNIYYYAVPDTSSRIEGLVIYQLPDWAMREIHRYEGNRYQRQAVRVNTAHGFVETHAYLASNESMQRHFGERFHTNLIHELWLRKRIAKFIRKRTRPGEETEDAELERRADRELLGVTERDLVISHYRTDAVSDYYLEHELDRPRPSIRKLCSDSRARPFIKNYLALVIRQVLLNQLEEKTRVRYRFQLEHMYNSDRYFKHSVSLLTALRMLNANRRAIDLIIEERLETMPYDSYDLIDYIKYAVYAADSTFDSRIAWAHLKQIRSNLHTGLVPLGAEIELSNLGADTIGLQRQDTAILDAMYGEFEYFHDFCLDILSWKLGGYIDDHSGATDQRRRRGFLELAPGRLNTVGQLSRPLTPDPWLLNQLIHEIVTFYDVKPHSLHLSFQLRKRAMGLQRVLPLGFVKCLLALGGGPEMRESGRPWVSRMGYNEITPRRYGEQLTFARTSRRSWYLGEDEVGNRPPAQATTYIQQYKFIRLDQRANYEPLILSLKGLQLGYNPGDYLTTEQLSRSRKLRREFAELKKWATEPTKIAPQSINRFLNTVQYGLMNERHHRPAHKLHYINWAISAIDVQLRMFNKALDNPSACA